MQSLPMQLTVRVTGTLSPLKTAILRWLSKGPRTFEDLVAAFGLPPTTIRACLRELSTAGLVRASTNIEASHIRHQYTVLSPIPNREMPSKSVAEDHSLLQYRRSLGAFGIVPDDV